MQVRKIEVLEGGMLKSNDSKPIKKKSAMSLRRQVFRGLLIAFFMLAVVLGNIIWLGLKAESDREVRYKIGERLVYAGSYRSGVTEYYLENKRWPQGSPEEICVQMGFTSGFRETENIKNILILADGVIEVTYTNKVDGGGKKLLLIPQVVNESVRWQCRNAEGAARFNDIKYLPTECR